MLHVPTNHFADENKKISFSLNAISLFSPFFSNEKKLKTTMVSFFFYENSKKITSKLNFFFHLQGTEEASAAAAAAVEPSADGEKAAAAEPVTNGTSDEVKTNGEPAAPVATPEESVTPPSNGDSKPIVDAAKETVEEVIVAASKSVDEKLNAVAKPEVNKNADQDHLQEQTHTQALESYADNSETNAKSVSSDSANIVTVPNENNVVETTVDEPKSVVVDTNDVDDVVVDCTNNSSNNDTDNINSQSSAPPLPDSPPPSQITVFAASAMSVDLNQVENPQTIPVIETETKIQSVSALVGDTKIELALPESVPADDAAAAAVVDDDVVVVDESHVDEPATVEVNDEQLATSNETNESQSETETHIQTDNNESHVESQIEPELPKPDAEIAETIAILDRVNLNESDAKPTVESVINETNNTEPLSADISSPLPQNSLDTLPSPQSLSSNVTPPNEIDESATVELSTEDASSLPPPPPIDDDIVAFDKPTEQSGSDATATDDVTTPATQNGNDDLLPPPPAQELIETQIVDELKTNGVTVADNDTPQNHSVEALNGDGNLNGSAKEHDEAANNITDKVITTIYETNALRTHWIWVSFIFVPFFSSSKFFFIFFLF